MKLQPSNYLPLPLLIAVATTINLICLPTIARSNPLSEIREPETGKGEKLFTASTQQLSDASGQMPFAPTNTTQKQAPTVHILSPKPNTLLDLPSSIVILQFTEGATVELRVNGRSIDSSSVGRTETDSIKHIVTQTWYGVVFDRGENILSAKATLNGVTSEEVSMPIQVSGKAKELKIETVEARIPADGRSTATVRGQLLDESGNRANQEAVITLNTSAGEFIGEDADPDLEGFQVQAKAGAFTATLRSPLDAQTVTIQAKAADLETFTQIQFETALRQEPLFTGFVDLRIGARGTNFYDSFRDFLPLDENNDTEIDLTSAFLTTGSIGQWNFIGAFNSDRPLNEDSDGNNRLFRTYQDSEKDYPIYGYTSKTDIVAPSLDRVYLRLERTSPIELADPDYVMWGDYNTEEFATASQEFSAVSRQLHGFKGNYNWGNLQFTGLYANNTEGFQRDTVVPDGTSGFYFLSRRLLVPGSEDIYIELEKLNDPGNVVSRQRLNLTTDYEIDYDRGTLLFREPVFRTDVDANGDILVRRIVATYQFESTDKDSNLFAGRLRYYFDRDFERATWLGTTYFREDRVDRDFQLYGFDALISLGDRGKFIAEYANSSNATTFASSVNGSAYRLELLGNITDKISGQTYYHTAERGFANNATVSFVPGQTRYGGDIQAAVSPTTNLKFQYEHQNNFGVAPRPIDTLTEFLDPLSDPIPGSAVDNSLTTISAGVQQTIKDAQLDVDLRWRDREDRLPPKDLSDSSTQLRSRLSVPLTDRLTFNALNEISLSANSDSVFSDRTGLGLDWEFVPGTTLSFAQQWFTSGVNQGDSLTSLGIQGDYHRI
jgi:hypothetical protein